MIDLEGLPLPKDVPPPGSCVRVEHPEPGLARLVLDPPHREHTVLDLPLVRDLDLALDRVRHDGALRGLVIAGREPLHFAFGADIDAIEAVEDPRLVERFVRLVHGVFRRLEGLKHLRTVAAVGGPVPGGAYELALCCQRIVAADHPKTRIGLPETQLGIVPGWGGCHRLPRRVGIVTALTAILKGRLYRAGDAKRLGLVDRLTAVEYLDRIAADVALGRDGTRRPRRGAARVLVDKNPVAAAFVASRARTQALTETGGHYPAVLEAIELVTNAPRTDMEEAEAKEAAAIARLAVGPVCKHLVALFRGSEAAKKLAEAPDGSKPAPFTHAGVVGAGVMGGEIASLCAERGLAVRLADLSREALDHALRDHRATLAKSLRRRRIERHEHDAALDRLDAVQGTVGFQRSEIVIEAVAERLEVKRKVLGALAEELADDAVLATNTSSLSVDAIAATLPHPERVLGLHFFNPVRRMPLVEIVRGKATSDEVVRRTAALALRLGKTPVVVRDVAGFLVNRVLGPYLDEALRLFAGGLEPERLDRALEDFGMPMGPLRLLDEVGFDIASHAAASLFEAYGERMRPSTALDGMVDEQRFGKKTGRGFYQHTGRSGGKTKKGPTLAPDLDRFRSQTALAGLPEEEIVERCLLPMVNEAARCLEEEVVAGPAELDLATVFGTGFAPFRGGLLRWADSMGTPKVVERLKAIASRPDVAARPGGAARFEPAPLLARLAERDGRFHG